MTAFYMFRAYMLVFEGPAFDPHTHPHASPRSMNFTLAVLSFFSVVGGFLALPGLWNVLHDWFNPVINFFARPGRQLWYPIQTESLEIVELGLGVGAGIAGIVVAVGLYTVLRQRTADLSAPTLDSTPETATGSVPTAVRHDPATSILTPRAMEEPELRRVLSGKTEKQAARAETNPGRRTRAQELNYTVRPKVPTKRPNPLKLGRQALNYFLLYGWGFDLLYKLLFAWPGAATGRFVARFFDPETEKAVDWGLGGLAWESSKLTRKTTTGLARNYALGILFGAVVLLVYVAIQTAVR